MYILYLHFRRKIADVFAGNTAVPETHLTVSLRSSQYRYRDAEQWTFFIDR